MHFSLKTSHLWQSLHFSENETQIAIVSSFAWKSSFSLESFWRNFSRPSENWVSERKLPSHIRDAKAQYQFNQTKKQYVFYFHPDATIYLKSATFSLPISQTNRASKWSSFSENYCHSSREKKVHARSKLENLNGKTQQSNFLLSFQFV